MGCGVGIFAPIGVTSDFSYENYNYCRLQATTAGLPSTSSRARTQAELAADLTLAASLESQNKLQEAIWLYRQDPASVTKANELQSSLDNILANGTFEISSKTLGGGTEKKLLNYTAGITAIFKPSGELWDMDPEAELAAYRLSELFEFWIVPTTVEKTIDNQSGVVQYFVKNMTEGNTSNVSARNIRKLLIFDYLVSNTDRNYHNVLYSVSDNLVYAIDHGRSFKMPCGISSEIKKHLEIETELRDKFRTLSQETVVNTLGSARSEIKNATLSRFKVLNTQ
jgi:hypothetical protein